MASSSSAPQNRPDLNTTPATQPEVWHPRFLNVQNQPLTVDDSVIYNLANATAVAEGLITPRDERILGGRSDLDVIRDSMALSAQATTFTANMARRLHTRNVHMQSLCDQVTRLQGLLDGAYRRMRALRAENRELQRMVDSYSNRLTPRVEALERLTDQIIDRERVPGSPQRQPPADPSSSTQGPQRQPPTDPSSSTQNATIE